MVEPLPAKPDLRDTYKGSDIADSVDAQPVVEQRDAYGELIQYANDNHLVYTGISTIGGETLFVPGEGHDLYDPENPVPLTLSIQKADSLEHAIEQTGEYGWGVATPTAAATDGDSYFLVEREYGAEKLEIEFVSDGTRRVMKLGGFLSLLGLAVGCGGGGGPTAPGTPTPVPVDMERWCVGNAATGVDIGGSLTYAGGSRGLESGCADLPASISQADYSTSGQGVAETLQTQHAKAGTDQMGQPVHQFWVLTDNIVDLYLAARPGGLNGGFEQGDKIKFCFDGTFNAAGRTAVENRIKASGLFTGGGNQDVFDYTIGSGCSNGQVNLTMNGIGTTCNELTPGGGNISCTSRLANLSKEHVDHEAIGRPLGNAGNVSESIPGASSFPKGGNGTLSDKEAKVLAAMARRPGGQPSPANPNGGQ